MNVTRSDGAARRGDAAPSIRDVAAAAGVSYQTVSRVLNDSPRVRADTRRLASAYAPDIDLIGIAATLGGGQ